MARSGDILGYARVSTSDQDLSGQIERLTKEGAVRVFEDVISGKTFKRPGLTALIDYARSGDTLAVIRLDRLGRSLKELLETVDTLKAQNIGLISLEERIDTTSAAGELVFHVFGAIAHFERRLISERTKDGLAAARKHGRTPGRPPLSTAEQKPAMWRSKSRPLEGSWIKRREWVSHLGARALQIAGGCPGAGPSGPIWLGGQLIALPLRPRLCARR